LNATLFANAVAVSFQRRVLGHTELVFRVGSLSLSSRFDRAAARRDIVTLLVSNLRAVLGTRFALATLGWRTRIQR
jgi:hypothetical protein